MNMPWEQRNHCGFRHQGESLGGNGSKQGGSVAIGEECAFASATSLEGRSQHGACGLGKIALGGHLRAKIGESFDRSQKAPEIVFLQWHALGQNHSRKRVTRAHSANLLVSLVHNWGSGTVSTRLAVTSPVLYRRPILAGMALNVISSAGLPVRVFH